MVCLLPSSAFSTIITLRKCKVIGSYYDPDIRGCVPIFKWDYQDIVVHSEQLDRLGIFRE